MKDKSGFFLIALLVIIGLTFCTKPHNLISEELPLSVIVDDLQAIDSVEENSQNEPNPELTYGPVTDIDGNIYRTVQIGAQTWMAENLKTTRYNDGSQIPYITDLIDWAQLIVFEKFVECPQLTTGAYYWCDNDSSNKDIYGAIYNWYAVDRGNLCPTGWHVPTDAEWTKLEYFLGGTQVAGGKLKESGTTHWLSPNTGATNESGFTALPGAVNDGYYGSDDWWLGDYDTGMYGLWWSASYYDIFGIYRSIINLYTPLYQGGGLKNCGASVRCLRD